MLVSELEIEEFRGVRSCERPLEFSNLTVLIGRNNVGKSAVLEALYLLPHPHVSDAIYGMPRIRIIEDKLHSGLHLAYGYSGEAKITYNNSFSIIIREGSSSLVVDNREVPSQPSELVNLFKLPKTYESEEKLASLVVAVFSDTGLMKKFDDKIREESTKNYIVKQGYNVSVTKLISSSVGDEFTEILLDVMKLRKELPDDRVLYIHVDDLGDGIKKAIRAMLIIEALSPKLVLWDDFEVFAHPSLIGILLRWLTKGTWQTVLTTHSIDVLYELLEIRPKDATVLQLEKTKNDVLKYEKLTIDDLEDLILANQDPRKVADVLELR